MDNVASFASRRRLCQSGLNAIVQDETPSDAPRLTRKVGAEQG